MAQIDLKECTIKAFDGTLGTLTVDCTNVDSDIVYTAVSKHIGSDKVSVEYIDPSSASASLSISVDGRKITVNLATSSASAITSTAAEVKTAIEGDSDANALVTMALETSGAGVVEAKAEDTLDGQNSITIKIGEGNLTYSEHRNVEFSRDRGSLDSVRLADEEPVDLSVDAMWEWIRATSGSSAPTLEDVVKQRGEASAWVSTADDTCQPYCVDIEVWNVPNCGTDEDEIIVFEEFYYETADHDLREGTLNFSGRSNRTEATVRREINADIG
jgi:hypothetical protein